MKGKAEQMEKRENGKGGRLTFFLTVLSTLALSTGFHLPLSLVLHILGYIDVEDRCATLVAALQVGTRSQLARLPA
mgnify:CR=1 FL=1